MSGSVSQDSGASSDEDRALQDCEATRYGRQALMLGAAAAGAGIALGLVGGAKPADASNGGSVLLGRTNTASDSTIINTRAIDGLQVSTTGDSGSHGVLGTSTSGTGVEGQTTGDGQSGVSGIDTSTIWRPRRQRALHQRLRPLRQLHHAYGRLGRY